MTTANLIVRGRLPPEMGALFMRALDAAREGVREEAHADAALAGETAMDPSDERVDFGNLQADALLRMAETALAHEPTALAAGERYQVVVHVDADTLPVHGDGLRSHMEDGPRVSAETSRRIACDCSRLCVHENADGEVLNIGRRSRQIPPAIRRALQLRDRGCRFPGCTEHRFVDGHHIQHWADGGETSLHNLVLLCRRHHRLVHEGGFSVRRHDRAKGRAVCVTFHAPDGRWLDPSPYRRVVSGEEGGEGLRRSHARLGLRMDARTATPRWAGERMDLSMAVAGLTRVCETGGMGGRSSWCARVPRVDRSRGSLDRPLAGPRAR